MRFFFLSKKTLPYGRASEICLILGYSNQNILYIIAIASFLLATERREISALINAVVVPDFTVPIADIFVLLSSSVVVINNTLLGYLEVSDVYSTHISSRVDSMLVIIFLMVCPLALGYAERLIVKFVDFGRTEMLSPSSSSRLTILTPRLEDNVIPGKFSTCGLVEDFLTMIDSTNVCKFTRSAFASSGLTITTNSRYVLLVLCDWIYS